MASLNWDITIANQILINKSHISHISIFAIQLDEPILYTSSEFSSSTSNIPFNLV